MVTVSVFVIVTVTDVPTVGTGIVMQLHAEEMSVLESVCTQVGKRELRDRDADDDGDGDGDADEPEDDDPLELEEELWEKVELVVDALTLTLKEADGLAEI